MLEYNKHLLFCYYITV